MTLHLQADNAEVRTLRKLSDAHIDITGAEHVQVLASKAGDRLWVNVNGVCVLRICQIKSIAADVKVITGNVNGSDWG